MVLSNGQKCVLPLLEEDGNWGIQSFLFFLMEKKKKT